MSEDRAKPDASRATQAGPSPPSLSSRGFHPLRRGTLKPWRTGELADAYHRLHQLSEVGQLLVSFESVDLSVRRVIAIVAESVPLRVGLVRELTRGLVRTITWRAAGATKVDIERSLAHLRVAHAYILGSGDAVSTGLLDRHGGEARAALGHDERFIVLPLATKLRGCFGMIQLLVEGELSEIDLVFVNTVVNQVAIALDRQAMIDANQSHADDRRHHAEGQQLVAERGRARAEHAAAAANASRVDAEHATHVALAELETAEHGAEAPHGLVWELDASTLQTTYVGGRAEALLGHSRERWLDDPGLFIATIHPDDVVSVVDCLSKVVGAKGEQRIDHRTIDADGRVLWFSTSVHVKRPPGSAPRLQGVSFDVTPTVELALLQARRVLTDRE
jgi:PAS domain-containing protein